MRCFVSVAILLVSAAGVMAKEKSPSIESIQAFMYYHAVGKWSPNVADPDFVIHNPSIGEGDLKHAATHTLFVVKAVNADYKYVKIKIEHQTDPKTIKTVHDERHDVGYIEEGEPMHVPVLLSKTIAGRYVVTAYVTDNEDKRISPVKTVTIVYGGCAL
jgi:hypothetical protein